MKYEILKLFAGVILSPLMLTIIFSTLDGKSVLSIFSSGDYGFIYAVGLIGAIVIGVPSYLLLKHYSHATYIYFFLAGFIGGFIIVFSGFAIDGRLPPFNSCLVFSISGTVVSSFFWFFSVYTPQKILRTKNENKL